MSKILLLLLIMSVFVSCGGRKQTVVKQELLNESLFMLVGGYAFPHEEGVKLFTFDEESGDAHYVNGLTGISNPSYLDYSSDCQRVFAVGENGVDNSTANIITIDWSTGSMELTSEMETRGAAPCYIALSPSEDFVVTANYEGGNVSIFRIGTDGKLQSPRIISFVGSGLDSVRQVGPHLHFVGFTHHNDYMLAVDLGTDCVHSFPINAQGKEISAPFLDEDKSQNFLLPPGCGPRHLCFSEDGQFLYIVTELSGEVLVYAYQGKNSKLIQRVRFDMVNARGGGDIHMSPDGKFLYASNRLKEDGIAIFKVDSETGMLGKVGYQPTGIHPRNFIISPNGKFLLVACRYSNEIQIYRRNEQTGLLVDIRKSIKTSQPSCLKFMKKR